MIFKLHVAAVTQIFKKIKTLCVQLYLQNTKKVLRNFCKLDFSLTLKKLKHIQFAGCRADKQDRGNCQYWKNTGYCHRSSKYYAYMQDHCYATCTNCNCK